MCELWWNWVHLLLHFVSIRCVLLWSTTNIANYSAPSLPWKLIQFHAEGKWSRHSPQRAVTQPRPFLFLFPPFRLWWKDMPVIFQGLGGDRQGFLSFLLLLSELMEAEVTGANAPLQTPCPPTLLAAESHPTQSGVLADTTGSPQETMRPQSAAKRVRQVQWF